MIIISICIGSACHLRGAHGVLEAFQLLIDKHRVKAVVTLEGNFCQNCCTEGVVIHINGELVKNVSKDQVHQIFCDRVLGSISDENNHNIKG